MIVDEQLLFKIGSRTIGVGNRCFVIAEVAQSHDGSLGMAHSFIDMVAESGADAIKFQTHIASAESTPQEPWRVPFSRQDTSRYKYWERMEFTAEQWAGLKQHADEKGLVFLSSPFSVEAVILLRKIGMCAWKIASGEVSNHQLLHAVLEDKKPVLLSSGLSGWQELDTAFQLIRKGGAPCTIFQCTSEYPTAPEKIGLNILDQIRARYSCLVGLSDHSGEIYTGLAAATLGASCLEVHIAFHKRMFGPDVPSSLDSKELTSLCRGVDAIHRMIVNPISKDEQGLAAEPLRQIFGRSIVLNRSIEAGTTLIPEMLSFKKPGTGMAPNEIDRVLGRRVRTQLSSDTLISYEDLF